MPSARSLDPAREARIFARVRQRVPTLIVITHRHALLQLADRTYRVENGGVHPFLCDDETGPTAATT
ncbi:hypothetical protein D3C72_2451940 [compost metagenome]